MTTTIRTITTRNQLTAAIPMHADDLADLTEHIDTLGLPADRHFLQPLRGWEIRQDGWRIGRILARGPVLVAEAYDETQRDWLVAKWGCRRLELGIAEILILRDEVPAA